MTTTKTKTPTEAHMEAAQAVERWTTELAAAREQVEKLTAEPVADPATAKKQAAALATAKEYSFRCARGLDDAVDARDAAAAAVVTAEADALEPEISAARAALDSFDAKVSELREPLEKFTGRQWTETDPVQAWRAAGGDGRARFKASPRARLVNVLRLLERRQKGLRTAAQGGDPVHVCPADELPASLLPGGVLPSPSLVAKEQARAEQAQADAEQDARMAEAQAKVDHALRALGVDLDVTVDAVESAWADQRGQRWRDRYGAAHESDIWADIDGHHARVPHLQTVAALAGWDAGNEVAEAVHKKIPATNDTGENHDQEN